ncbi:MAG: hypothetical protein IT331_08285 [Anaerolineae bacterium]|nr:hypothetical protein [Anaerolineae bacterium]
MKDEQGNIRQSKAFSIIEDVFTQHGTNEVIEIFGNAQIFPFPKPTAFVSKLISIGIEPNEEQIVFDFFAGSGTTAQAVLELNEEDGGNRRFVCIQMPELLDEESEAYKAGYKSVEEICRTRISRVIGKVSAIRQEQPQLEAQQLLGFQSYRLAPSNFKTWRGDVEGQDEIIEQLDLFHAAEKETSISENMLYELMLKAGLPLTTKIDRVDVDGQSVFLLADGKLLVFFDSFTPAVSEFIHARAPQRVVCLDRAFKGDDQALTNLQLELQESKIELTVL